MIGRRKLLLSGLSALCTTQSGSGLHADETEILEVDGKIGPAAGPRRRRYSESQLRQLGVVSYTTRTPWYQDRCTFEGVLLSSLMQDVGATGQIARIIALNDYTADVSIEDLKTYRPILASRRNGQLMPVSDKGPLFVVFDYDALPSFQHQRFYSRSVWQVCHIDVI